MSDPPHTRASLGQDLRHLGLRPGMTVLAHTAMSRLGWVCGGPVAVIQALLDAIAPDGTLVMPAFSSDLTDPAQWTDPPVPVPWIAPIRAAMPPFDPQITPTRGMGRIAELFRTWPGTLRSGHPICSFAARGRNARMLLAEHPLEDAFGERSPLARLYERAAMVLLLGVGFEVCTAFHLAEPRARPDRPPVSQGTAQLLDGRRRWVEFQAYPHDDGPFAAIGADFAAGGLVADGRVGGAEARFLPLPEAVDFATGWLRRAQ